MTDKPISELDGLSHEEALHRCRERIVDMLVLQGKLGEALLWLAKDLEAYQRGEDR
jgi:hypothetical protein